jgi:hypothetical protein
MDLDLIDTAPEATVRAVLKEIFTKATTPAFGVLPQRELDLLLFKALRDCKILHKGDSLYSLMTDLKITRAKARNLLFDLQIREASAMADLDRDAREALARPRGFVLDGSYLAFGVENPVVQAHIKDRVTQLGHLADASFDSTVIRVKPSAIGVLAAALMDDDEEEAFRDAMVAAGFERDKSMAAFLKAGLMHVAEKIAGEDVAEIGESYLEDLAGFFTPYASKAKSRVVKILKAAFKRDKTDDEGPRIR